MAPDIVHPKTLKEARQLRWIAAIALLLASIGILLVTALPVLLDTGRTGGAGPGAWIGFMALVIGFHNAETRYRALRRSAEGVDGDPTAADGPAAA